MFINRFSGNIIFLILFFISISSYSQYTSIGNGAFTSLIVAPMYSTTNAPQYNRCAYVYPASSFTGLRHGDTITSISFFAANSDPMRGNPNFKIYLANSIFSDLGPTALDWNSTINQSELVYDDNPAALVNGVSGFVRFPFNQSSGYKFDTTGGAIHLMVMVEYEQTDSQSSNIFWYAENRATVPAYQSNNETKYISGIDITNKDTFLSGSSVLKPTIRIEYPHLEDEIEYVQMHALGSIATLMNRGDTIKARFLNIGKETQYNKTVYLEVQGANSHIDSLIIDSLIPFKEKLIRFPEFQSSSIGTETISVKIEDDDNNSNNTGQINRRVDYNKASHTSPFSPNNGGIGIGGGTGDFVAKFYTGGINFINQITLQFTTRNNPFQLGIWDADSITGLPAKLLFLSDTLRTNPGEYILDLDSQVTVNRSFFVGIRQTSDVNVGFGFQTEIPVRPDVFFFTAPAGDTTWTPFSPGFNFNFGITPRFQAANDISVSEIITPLENDSFQYESGKKIAISATVRNVGFNDQTDSFDVRARVFDLFGSMVYQQTQKITLLSDSVITLNFDSFELSTLGRYRLEIESFLAKDSIIDNNRIIHFFHTFLTNDISVPFSYVPFINQRFVRNDSIYPSVNISNNGINRQTNVPITYSIIHDEDTLYSSTELINLNANATQIVDFPPAPLHFDGVGEFMCYSSLNGDVLPNNDTLRVPIIVEKTNDILPLFFRSPTENSVYPFNFNIDPLARVRNDGLEDVDSAYFYLFIQNSTLDTIYSDTTIMEVKTRSTTDVNFKRFNTGIQNNILHITLIGTSKNDQDNSNDTLKNIIYVMPQFDPTLESISWTPFRDTIDIDENLLLEITMNNLGFDTVRNVKLDLEILDSDDNVFYAESLDSIDIPNNQSKIINNSDNIIFPKGEYTVKAILSHPLDQKTDNNSQERILRSDTLEEYGIIEIITPEVADTLFTTLEIFPEIVVENRGVKWNTDPITAVCYITSSDDTIYQSQLLANIVGKTSKNIVFDAFSKSEINEEGTIIYKILVNDKVIEDNKKTLQIYLKDTAEKINIFELSEDNLIFYPNPSKGKSFIKSSEPIQQIQVFAADGKLIYTSEQSHQVEFIHMLDLIVTKGFYVVVVKTKNSQYPLKWIVD